MNRSLRNKVSIVLPTYNGTKYIKQSIESCLNQTYKNIELIVVDDGSSENVKKLIDNLLSFQYENDGFPNTIGYFGDPQLTSWQDIICSTRWNAYCFLLLSELVDEEYRIDDSFVVIHKAYGGKIKKGIFTESKDYIEWKEGNRIIKHFNKR